MAARRGDGFRNAGVDARRVDEVDTAFEVVGGVVWAAAALAGVALAVGVLLLAV